ncbi:MAG: hypothetical protein FWG31_07385 [Oscillospiraceae bacterium]|nr:hypothetical protein [Oscillospiraceae bacterium]
MQDEPNNTNENEMDEIDKFLATLPSLHISEDMVDEGEYKVNYKPQKHKVQLTSIFALLAWLVLLFSLLWAYQAFPSSSGTFFSGYTGISSKGAWNAQYITDATFYLFGNVVVCLGGLAVCLAKKMKLFSGSALNFWIAGGLSAIMAIVLMAA